MQALPSMEHDGIPPRGGRLRSYGCQKESEEEAREKSHPSLRKKISKEESDAEQRPQQEIGQEAS